MNEEIIFVSKTHVEKMPHVLWIQKVLQFLQKMVFILFQTKAQKSWKVYFIQEI